MAYESKPGNGALFKNDRKEKDTHPDYKGSINIGGTEWQLSAWIKDGKKGKFLSLSAQQPYQKEQAPRGRQPGEDDDMIPF